MDVYASFGYDLAAAPRVGLGSVCRRQDTAALAAVIAALPPELNLHGFGVKQTGLRAAGHRFASADSMAWSSHARRRPPLPGCKHRSCVSCLPYAFLWRERLLDTLDDSTRSGQLSLSLQ